MKWNGVEWTDDENSGDHLDLLCLAGTCFPVSIAPTFRVFCLRSSSRVTASFPSVCSCAETVHLVARPPLLFFSSPFHHQPPPRLIKQRAAADQQLFFILPDHRVFLDHTFTHYIPKWRPQPPKALRALSWG